MKKISEKNFKAKIPQKKFKKKVQEKNFKRHKTISAPYIKKHLGSFDIL